jgi:adenine-specific DNA-methyltransferase
MADEVDVLLSKVQDAELRNELRSAINKVRAKRSFGLVFESHLPERVNLTDHPIRRGVRVAKRSSQRGSIMRVEKIRKGIATCAEPEGTTTQIPIHELVVVAEFGEPVYPGLMQLGEIRKGGDKPAHIVINGENHHALEMLQFTHAAKVDCIYIDPPYNTGAKDWKYDNNYVDSDDGYRHSKWLAFMERRLLLAKQLLNPANSVLIVTIDEKEYLRLGMLIQQVFAGYEVQMVSSVINPAGSARVGRFTRVDEYIFFVFLGEATALQTGLNFMTGKWATTMPTLWFSATRNGLGNALRANRTTPVLFYPVHIDEGNGRFHSVGSPLGQGKERHSYSPPSGTIAIWPISSEGREQTWRFSSEKMLEFFETGTARLGRRDPTTGHRPITYLQPGTLDLVKDGVYRVEGRGREGELILSMTNSAFKPTAPSSVWNVGSHFARDYGSKMLAGFVPGRVFPYPKSLYAVEDCLRIIVAKNPGAVIVDFFAGSGTTAHAVMRLNRQDGGHRQSISITNNEVSAEEAKSLSDLGYVAGNPDWEKLGIFEHITRPRIAAAVLGTSCNGDPVKGDYKFTDEFPMSEGFDENVTFMKLAYLDPVDVELARAFQAIAPLLWMRAGGKGDMLVESKNEAGNLLPFATTNRYGILFDCDEWAAFVDDLPETAKVVYVVTDSPSTFAGVASSLPSSVEPIRLYENYLTTFAINQGRLA